MNIQNNTNRNSDNKKNERQVYTDYNIFGGKIRLINDDGKVEVIDRDEAIERAKSIGMNLVQVSYLKNEFPRSVCKILDYGKYKFEQKKREKEAARKSRIANAEAKEVVFSIRIDDGDFNHKINQISDFLFKDNLKVKITIKLSRREMSVKHMAKDLMMRILNKFNDTASLDGSPIDAGRDISCTIKALKTKKNAI